VVGQVDLLLAVAVESEQQIGVGGLVRELAPEVFSAARITSRCMNSTAGRNGARLDDLRTVPMAASSEGNGTGG
jgi:hypothetical protein